MLGKSGDRGEVRGVEEGRLSCGRRSGVGRSSGWGKGGRVEGDWVNNGVEVRSSGGGVVDGPGGGNEGLREGGGGWGWAGGGCFGGAGGGVGDWWGWGTGVWEEGDPEGPVEEGEFERRVSKEEEGKHYGLLRTKK